MTETLFERYKEALRAGHVAVVRGRLEEAAAAYRQAVVIAPDRTVPRAALGNVLLRLGDPAAALEASDEALAIAPDDDAAILGRAQALVVLRRTDEAAATYDRLADVRQGAGRRREAAEAARRALAIEPSEPRRARHTDLVEALRAAEGPAVAETQAVPAEGAGQPAPEPPEAAAAPPEPEPPPPAPDPEELVIALEVAAARGDVDAAAAAALAAGRAYRERGQVSAAFDAVLEGIEARPADVELHLLLADLAIDRGWTGHAAETYRNLLRLVKLDGDAVLAERVRAAAASRLPPELVPRDD
jgi:tetratricopeptide (TPR) repeat protein